MLYNVGINLEEYGSLAGGAISEKLGGSYELGATIGNIVGGVAGSVTYSKIVSMKNISATKAPNNECHPNCFIAGTLVATSDGYKAIEEIQAVDMVLAENPETGEIALKRVVQTFENESDELVHVFVNGEEIITTPNHPFYVPKLGWTSAIKLRAGDILVLSNGEYVVVEFVQHEILEEPVKVHNLEVEDFHTYFVGESSILVHNKCSGSYDIEFQSGKHSVGKGNEARMRKSARRVSQQHHDPVVNMEWRWARNDEVAFIDEHMRMSKYGFDFYHPHTNPNGILYNQIMSPGAKIFGRWFQ